MTPLHYAVRFGPFCPTSKQRALEAITLLLRNGADVNALSNDGKTPAHFAADNSFPELSHILPKAIIDAGIIHSTKGP